ncbi:MAG TPA: hypothetical protein VIW29_23400 [Polyangiaceae bacterium]
MRRVLAAGTVSGCSLLGAARLSAQELGPILLSYRASDGCPEVAVFQQSVQRRSARIHFVDEGTHERELMVVLAQASDGTTGELRLTERDGTLRQRSVKFSTCAEAVEGLALITAVSLDPQLALEPRPEAASEPAAAPAEPATKAPPAEPAAPPPPHARPTEVALGGELTVAVNALPETAFGGAAFVDVASGSQSWLAPLFRGAFSHSQRRNVAEGTAEAHFTLTLGTLSACPARFGASWLALRPCLFGSAGALHAWGTGSPEEQSSTRFYAAWGGSLLLFLKVSQHLEIVADAALGNALIRDEFVLDEVPFWETPPLYVSSGIGARFVFR